MRTPERQLIVHMDDMGTSLAANAAGFDLFGTGNVTSASVIVPAPAARAFVEWGKLHPQFDVGLHLAHSSEWEVGRWAPLTPRDEGPSLYDEEGFLPRGSLEDFDAISPKDFSLEVLAQWRQCVRWGFEPSHLDNHMFSSARQDAFLDFCLRFAAECHRPFLVKSWMLWNQERELLVRRNRHAILVQDIDLGASEDPRVLKESLVQGLAAAGPGLHYITLHPVVDSLEIRAIIPTWRQRHAEYRLFRDPEVSKLIRDSGMTLVSWRDVKVP